MQSKQALETFNIETITIYVAIVVPFWYSHRIIL